MPLFCLDTIDTSWRPIVTRAINTMDRAYLDHLYDSTDWLPGHDCIFSAFSQPVNQINYVLFGESPYPRKQSANGYAFWDAAISTLWSTKGLSKEVNRATSMRNIIKMLLIAEGLLQADNISQPDIAALDKSGLIKNGDDLFNNLLKHGFLLLNTTPVLQPGPPQKDARAWQPFMHEILTWLLTERPHVYLLLFGRIANDIQQLIHLPSNQHLICEHPYNLSFIHNQSVQNFFRPLCLLRENLKAKQARGREAW